MKISITTVQLKTILAKLNNEYLYLDFLKEVKAIKDEKPKACRNVKLPEVDEKVLRDTLLAVSAYLYEKRRIHPNLNKGTTEYNGCVYLAEILIGLKEKYEFNYTTKFITNCLMQVDELMKGKLALGRVKGMEVKIRERLDIVCEIFSQTKDEKNKVKEMITEYVRLGREISNIDPRLIFNNYQNYHKFVLARKQCDKNKINHIRWIQVQYECLAFLNVLPAFGSLSGQKAFSRYTEYVVAKQNY